MQCDDLAELAQIQCARVAALRKYWRGIAEGQARLAPRLLRGSIVGGRREEVVGYGAEAGAHGLGLLKQQQTKDGCLALRHVALTRTAVVHLVQHGKGLGKVRAGDAAVFA